MYYKFYVSKLFNHAFFGNQASDSVSDFVVVPGEDKLAGIGVVVVASVGFPLPPSAGVIAPSSMFGTIKLSRDIKLYFITKDVNRLQRWDIASKSSNRVL